VRMQVAAPHRKRPVRFVRRERIRDWRLKLYGIAMPGAEPRPELLDATVAVAAGALPDGALTDDRYGIAFAIAHDATSVCFALVYWWQAENELHQRCFWSPRDDPTAMRPIEHPAAGCVWELEAIDFERRAWIEDVLANPEGPDVERYLSRELSVEV
jgi:hypothetical protein